MTGIGRRALLASPLGLFGCTQSTPRPAPPTRAPSPTAGRTGSTPTRSPSPTPRPHPVSLPALMVKAYDGGALRVGRVLADPGPYRRHFVTYRSGGLTISGILNIPRGKGPFPVVVMNHGYIDPAVYTNGRGLRREQHYLAGSGYAVLHIDYRNHAQSSDDPSNDLRLRIGYVEDAINAVKAVRTSRVRALDGDRVAFLGRSMGGGVTYNALVAQPGLVAAGVVFAPVSASAVDNFRRWTGGQEATRIISAYGSPERNPDFWANLSANRFFDRITEPLLVHHGTVDESCPIAWSRRSVAGLRQAGVDVEFHVYPGEPHTFAAAWPLSMRRTRAFLDRHLAGS